jgi:hypothetical protein
MEQLRHSPRDFWRGYQGAGATKPGAAHPRGAACALLGTAGRRGAGRAARVREPSPRALARTLESAAAAAQAARPQARCDAAGQLSSPITSDEVQEQLLRMRGGAAAGADGLGANLKPHTSAPAPGRAWDFGPPFLPWNVACRCCPS